MENTCEFYTDINDISLIEEDGEQVVYLTKQRNWGGINVGIENDLVEHFEDLKEMFLDMATHFVAMDQELACYCRDKLGWELDAEPAYGFLEEEDLLSIVYWQNGVNNEFTVSFRYVDNQFVLDGFNGYEIIK